MLLYFVNILGKKCINLFNTVGGFMLFMVRIVYALFTTKLKMHQVLLQIRHIGVGSLSIVFLTGTSIGLALALQTYVGLSRFGAHELIGVVVALGMTRELGPIMTSLMVTGRSGASMTAELGTMQISEQIDALRTLCVNPYQYLVIPRIIASMIVTPLLTIFSMLCGIIGGYIYSVYVLGFTPESYLAPIRMYSELSDIMGGLFKSSIFGFILAWVGTYYGYHTSGGARGVGYATTSSVVTGSIFILVVNYLLSSLLFQTGN